MSTQVSEKTDNSCRKNDSNLKDKAKQCSEKS
jgi:hypothetical protein